MGINMDNYDLLTFFINGILFFIAYKIGQISVWNRLDRLGRSEIQQKSQEVVTPKIRPVITVEEINGVYYAYDGNDFLAQGSNPDELGELIAKRYPYKYHRAKVEIKA